ncbi:hypothetical protein [Bacillus sp. E(2018)]|uniref:hypothetical protein n=1 Tax=Bacillus sp. E(2018) TaxID=2502239 RepID=UPI0010F5E47D|nr:hypothetical protein [Bacillus sp. E(2018)]
MKKMLKLCLLMSLLLLMEGIHIDKPLKQVVMTGVTIEGDEIWPKNKSSLAAGDDEIWPIKYSVGMKNGDEIWPLHNSSGAIDDEIWPKNPSFLVAGDDEIWPKKV